MKNKKLFKLIKKHHLSLHPDLTGGKKVTWCAGITTTTDEGVTNITLYRNLGDIEKTPKKALKSLIKVKGLG